MDYVAKWSERTGIAAKRIVPWLGIRENKFYDWKQRYGRINEHNGKVPRDWWLTENEIAAILRFHDEHPLEGYRRLTFLMLDQDVVAVAPSTVHRVLSQHGKLKRQHWSPSKNSPAASKRSSTPVTANSPKPEKGEPQPGKPCAKSPRQASF